ncbi:MAG: hypothetical protein AB3K77_08070 [Methanosarcinaceae archaeon]|nr:hypothetical protein [Methanosarcina sp. MTP4]
MAKHKYDKYNFWFSFHQKTMKRVIEERKKEEKKKRQQTEGTGDE